MNNKDKLINLRINKNDWELFKGITKLEGSNASVEIRKFIKQYLTERTDKINELIKKGKK